MDRKYAFLSALFSVCLVASNLFETKIFAIGPLTLTGGLLVFPVSYIVNDCLSELYGFRNTSFTILTAMLLNLAAVCLAWIVNILPAADIWDGADHFRYLFNSDLKITAASMAAFFFGSIMNAKVMTVMKHFQGEKGFCRRAIVSTIAGETIDSVIFFPIAFYGVGVANIFRMMLLQIVLKSLYEIVLLPFTSHLVKILKK